MSPAVLVTLYAALFSAAAAAGALILGTRIRSVSAVSAATSAGALLIVAVLHLTPASAALNPAAPVFVVAGLAGAVLAHLAFEGFGVRMATLALILAGVGVHSFADGLVIAVVGVAGADILRSSAPGMLLHEVPETVFCYFAASRAGIRPAAAAGVSIGIGGGATLVGALVSGPLVAGATDAQLGGLLALSAGLMVYSGGSILLAGPRTTLWKRGAAAGAGAATISAMIALAPAHRHLPGSSSASHPGHIHASLDRRAPVAGGLDGTAYRFDPNRTSQPPPRKDDEK